MANTYKNIVVTPSRNSNSDDPKITFSGANTTANTDITLRMYPTSNGTLSFEGSAGQLFSINNDLTGTIYSVNDVSGIPSLAVYANGQVDVARFSGNTFIGTNGHVMTVVGNTWNNSTGTGLVVRGFNSVGSGITLQPSNSSSFSAGWSMYAGASGAAIGDGAFGFWNHTAQTYSFWADQSNNTFSSASSRAPIFYDTNNTGYYLDPASTSELNKVFYNSNMVSRNFGIGQVGLYDSFKYQAVFSMGEAYLLPANGANTGNLYGIAWSHPNAGGIAGNLSSHGMLMLENGTFMGAWGGGSLRTPSDVRGTLFYDYNNTSYYVDPAASTALRTIGDWRADSSSWTGEFAGKIQYHSNTWYLQASGNWIFRNASGSDIFTFSGGGTASATGDFRAPIFYDTNNTAFFTDPASNSFLNTATVTRLLARQSGISLGTGNSSQLEISNAASGACNISFHREGQYGAHFGLDTDNVFSTLGWSAGGGFTGMRVGNFTANGTAEVTSLGVGTASSGTTGEIRATNNITAYFSDERLKTNLGNIQNAVEKVLTLNGFYYEPNETAQKLGYKVKREVGLSAQQVQRILPEVVVPAPIDANYLTLHYDKIVPLLVEAIKEQAGEISELKQALAALLNKQ